MWLLCLSALGDGKISVAQERPLKDRLLGDEPARWEITADKMSYREKEGLYVAEGHVVISREGQVLSADKARYNEKTGIVKVSGNVVLEVKGDVVSGEEAVFNLNTHKGRMTKGRLFLRKNHFIVTGDVIEKTGPDTYRVENCRLTTCEGDRPDWSITGSEVEVTIEGYGKVKNTVFRIRDVPVLYLPYAIFPVKTRRQSGFLPPRIGYSNLNGLDGELPFFWAIADQADVTFYERFISERGFMQGLEGRYVAEEDSKGIFLFNILSDRVKTKDLRDPDQAGLSPFPRTNQTRYWLRGGMDQALPLDVALRLDADYVSDQDYLREFETGLFGYEARPELRNTFKRPLQEIQSPTRRSALRLSRDQENYSLQASGAHYERAEDPSEDDTPQPFGWFFEILPRPVQDFPLFFGLVSDYDYVWREAGLKGHRFSFTPHLSTPMWLGRYLEFEPSFLYSLNTQWIEGDDVDQDRRSTGAYDFRGRVSTTLERVYDMDWMEAKRLKHKFFPSLTYRYRVPEHEEKLQPWFEPIEEEGKVNTLTLTLENFLDVRQENDKGEVRYNQWAIFALSQAYNIDEARREDNQDRPRQPFEPLLGEVTLRILPYVDLRAEAAWDYYDESIAFADATMEVNIPRSGGRTDHVSLDYEYEKDGKESITYTLDVNLLYGFAAGIAQTRDLGLKKDNTTRMYLDYQSQCWGLRFSAESLDEVDTIMVTFRLLGLGQVGDL
jgi:LPS-assembly protein